MQVEILDNHGPVKFAGFRCLLCRSTYTQNDATALFLVDVEDGGPVAMVTSNIPGVSERLANDEVLVKNYSENAGILQTLVGAGQVLLEATGESIAAGYTTLEKARVLK